MKNIAKSAHIEGVYRIDRWEYPIEALREVIRNAVVHRDYSLTGKDIKIAIFDDMLEITSPGKLMPSVDFSKMLAGQSDIRNKAIASVFKKLGIIEQWGNGLKIIYQELEKYPDIKIVWKDVGMAFQVQFIKHGNQSLVKAPEKDSKKTEEKIIALIIENNQITIPELAEKLNLTTRTIERKIQILQKENILERIGSRKKGKWKIVSG